MGLILPEDPIDATFGFGVEADLGTLIPDLGLYPFLDFWTKSYNEKAFGSDGDWRYTEIAIGAVVRYFFEIDSQIQPYAGGGLALNFGRVSWKYSTEEGKVSDSDTDTDIGIHLLGGGAMDISPQWKGFAELKYAVDGADYFGIYVGAIYKLK